MISRTVSELNHYKILLVFFFIFFLLCARSLPAFSVASIKNLSLRLYYCKQLWKIKKANVLIQMISFATVLLEIYFKGKYKEAIRMRKRRERGEGRDNRCKYSTKQQEQEDEDGQGHRAP